MLREIAAGPLMRSKKRRITWVVPPTRMRVKLDILTEFEKPLADRDNRPFAPKCVLLDVHKKRRANTKLLERLRQAIDTP